MLDYIMESKMIEKVDIMELCEHGRDNHDTVDEKLAFMLVAVVEMLNNMADGINEIESKICFLMANTKLKGE